MNSAERLRPYRPSTTWSRGAVAGRPGARGRAGRDSGPAVEARIGAARRRVRRDGARRRRQRPLTAFQPVVSTRAEVERDPQGPGGLPGQEPVQAAGRRRQRQQCTRERLGRGPRRLADASGPAAATTAVDDGRRWAVRTAAPATAAAAPATSGTAKPQTSTTRTRPTCASARRATTTARRWPQFRALPSSDNPMVVFMGVKRGRQDRRVPASRRRATRPATATASPTTPAPSST